MMDKLDRAYTVRGMLGGMVTMVAVLAQGESLALKPAADTSLFERFAANNLGRSWLAAGTIASGHGSRALVRFDLASLPANAAVSSVAIGFRVVKSPGGAPSSTFELRRVLQPWSEGAKGTPVVRNNGGAAAAGESSWTSRGPGDWASPGGAVGTDFATTPSGTAALTGTTLAFASTPELVADVQAWLQNPDQNFGWVLLTQSEGTAKTARRFGSRETANNEPSLTIEYTVSVLPTAPMLSIPTKVGDKIQFEFAAEANHGYTVEFVADVGAAPWQSLTNFAATPTARTQLVEDLAGELARYYRVRSP